MLPKCFNEQLGEVIRVMGLARLLWQVEGLQVLNRCRSIAAATATATATTSLPSKALYNLIRPYKLTTA